MDIKSLSEEIAECISKSKMIDLQTRNINEVPYGGVFIANNDDVSMGFRPNEFDAYIKVEEFGEFIKLEDWKTFPFINFNYYWSQSQAEVAFTGIVLPLREIKEQNKKKKEKNKERII